MHLLWTDLEEEFRNFLRLQHYAYRTEEAYLDWVRRYIGSFAPLSRPAA